MFEEKKSYSSEERQLRRIPTWNDINPYTICFCFWNLLTITECVELSSQPTRGSPPTYLKDIYNIAYIVVLKHIWYLIERFETLNLDFGDSLEVRLR